MNPSSDAHRMRPDITSVKTAIVTDLIHQSIKAHCSTNAVIEDQESTNQSTCSASSTSNASNNSNFRELCTFCGDTFAFKSGMLRHIKYRCKKNPSNICAKPQQIWPILYDQVNLIEVIAVKRFSHGVKGYDGIPKAARFLVSENKRQIDGYIQIFSAAYLCGPPKDWAVSYDKKKKTLVVRVMDEKGALVDKVDPSGQTIFRWFKNNFMNAYLIMANQGVYSLVDTLQKAKVNGILHEDPMFMDGHDFGPYMNMAGKLDKCDVSKFTKALIKKIGHLMEFGDYDNDMYTTMKENIPISLPKYEPDVRLPLSGNSDSDSDTDGTNKRKRSSK
jgi:hypothetical protein